LSQKHDLIRLHFDIQCAVACKARNEQRRLANLAGAPGIKQALGLCDRVSTLANWYFTQLGFAARII
jgi:hypothetical protein